MYRFNEIATGSGSVALRPGGATLRPPRPQFGHKVESVRTRVGDLDLVVDLGQRIGSREWFRGLVTCTALCYAAWSFAPDMGPIEAFSPAPFPDAQFQEARALNIAPLAYGADTGRRMAPTDAVQPLADIPERPVIDLRATLGRGDGLARVLERAGVAHAEADRVASMIGEIVPVTDLRPGTVMDLTLGRRPNRMVARPLDKLSFRARFDLRIELNRVGGLLTTTRIPIAVDETPLRIQGQVGSSLYRAARAAGVPARAIETYLRAISSQVSVSDIGASDRFDFVIEHRRAATGETETGQLLYAGLDRVSGRDLKMMQWTVDGRAQWYEASGVGRQRGGIQQPVPGPITSNYGLRMHPILRYSRMHRGLDFRASYGTPILAAMDGTVSRAGWAGGYGKQVRLSHGNGLATSYSHMSRFAVSPGARVRQGQVIGYVGSTGLSTGPHLHYEMYRSGQTINPRSVRFTERAQLSGADLASFRSRLRSLLATPLGAARTAEVPASATAAP
ncbi:peptidoglycan DD-metalloendopeptidase family protein [Sphingosinicella sp. LHD-64]|uniref:peptidoglycan DD-metalloendopeptidase family protein n=1 Tax=Sphingosinicella sp. LHD-64 TaxID=3072139 RepID=UPI00280D675D|nr:peptidoglycan DD-metalloendopeptidase family protein [Sphingosinicella sp. LHD-64]MDQ8756649.1 peptidoglycan DD-metalloendopeptidase family protein [Sphingosinicella sp. LHD-64]